jgi:Uma2 family endonuclease
MADPVKRRSAYDDLLAVPDHLVAEIVDGELLVNPRPAVKHARASSRLGSRLGGPFDDGKGGPGGWVILDEPELHLHGDVLVPDLGGWRRERMPLLPESASIELAPDWVCEVISPRTAIHDRGSKRAIYAREGVTHLWLVDPDVRMLEVLRLLPTKEYVVAGVWSEAALVRAEPFEAVELELGALWER